MEQQRSEESSGMKEFVAPTTESRNNVAMMMVVTVMLITLDVDLSYSVQPGLRGMGGPVMNGPTRFRLGEGVSLKMINVF